MKLFINTIISAYGLERSVDIEVANLNQVSDSATGKTYILYADVDFSEKTMSGSQPVKFKLDIKGMKSPVIKISFYKADGDGNKERIQKEFLIEENHNSKEIKAAMWILAKMLIKETYGMIIEEKYHIVEKILEYKDKCDDYAMKGTIYYILCYISQNEQIKNLLNEQYYYFFNTDICFPKNPQEIFINHKTNITSY